MEADEDIEQARKALVKPRPGVERALARAESALIEVDLGRQPPRARP